MVILAVPYPALAALVPQIASALAGKVVIDPTNPLNDDYSPMILGAENSAAEQIAEMAPEARVVKGFNAIFAANLTPEAIAARSRPAAVFLASDDVDAMSSVADFIFGPRTGPGYPVHLDGRPPTRGDVPSDDRSRLRRRLRNRTRLRVRHGVNPAESARVVAVAAITCAGWRSYGRRRRALPGGYDEGCDEAEPSEHRRGHDATALSRAAPWVWRACASRSARHVGSSIASRASGREPCCRS